MHKPSHQFKLPSNCYTAADRQLYGAPRYAHTIENRPGIDTTKLCPLITLDDDLQATVHYHKVTDNKRNSLVGVRFCLRLVCDRTNRKTSRPAQPPLGDNHRVEPNCKTDKTFAN